MSDKVKQITIDDSVTDKESIYKILAQCAHDEGISIFKVADSSIDNIQKMDKDCRRYRQRISELAGKESKYRKEVLELERKKIKLEKGLKELEKEINFRVMNDSRSNWLDL